MSDILWKRGRRLTWLLAILLFALPAGTHAACEPDTYVPGEVLVGLEGSRPAASVLAAVQACAGCEEGRSPALGVCRVRLHPGVDVEAALARLRKLPGVAFAEPNGVVAAAATPNDPYFGTAQRGMRLIQMDRAWEEWKPVAPVTIAIVDSGIDHTHPDLTRKILRDASGIVGYDAFTGARADALDDHWHGTHCAGIAAAEANNGLGVAGVAGWDGYSGTSETTFVRLMPIKVLGRSGFGDDWRVGNGIVWAVDHGARVISLSLVTKFADQTMARAVSYALQKGCVVVAAAGNDAATRLNYPAAFPGVISVGATDLSDDLTLFSTYGSWVQMAAPGQSIISTAPSYPTPENGTISYRHASGSSMACPHVAGAAALVLSQNPGLSPSQVGRILTTHVDPYTPTNGHMLAPGAGRLNVYRALRAAGGGQASPRLILSSVTAEPAAVLGGEAARLLVRLAAPAPSSARLSITADAGILVESPVTPPEGATELDIPLTTLPVTRPTYARITVDGGGGSRRTTTLRLLPPIPPVAAVALSPTTITGGRTTRATLTLSAPAPIGGATVPISTDRPDLLTVPASVLIAAGKTTVSFTVSTRAVGDPIAAQLTAGSGPAAVTTELRILTASLSALTLRPSLVRAGFSTNGQVTLDAPAPPGGLLIELESSDPAVAAVDAEVVVPAGATSAKFPVRTSPQSAIDAATITARCLGVSRDAKLRILLPISTSRVRRLTSAATK